MAKNSDIDLDDVDVDTPGTILPADGEYQTNPHTVTGDNAMYDELTAQSINKAYRERKYKAKAVVIGNPSLTPNMVIKINNVGSKYSGNWWVKKVHHKISDSQGYVCELELQRDAIGTEDMDTTGRKDGTVTENTKNVDETAQETPATTQGSGDGEEEYEYIDGGAGRRIEKPEGWNGAQ